MDTFVLFIKPIKPVQADFGHQTQCSALSLSTDGESTEAPAFGGEVRGHFQRCDRLTTVWCSSFQTQTQPAMNQLQSNSKVKVLTTI